MDFDYRPQFAAEMTDELLLGSNRLRNAFMRTPVCWARPGSVLMRPGDPQTSIFLLRGGFMLRSCVFSDGRRAILNVQCPGDFVALDNVVLRGPAQEIAATSRVEYHRLPVSNVRELMADHAVQSYVLALIARSTVEG